MPDRTSYPAGAFSWAELATSDPEAAKAFYATVLGWSYDDQPLPGGGTYSMAQIRGRSAASIFAGDPQQGPPHWNAYVTVASVEDAAARAAALGATVLAPPFHVMDAGRMTVLRDPSGVVVSLWEPARIIGAEVVNEHGAMTWNELATRDPEAAIGFWTELLGWRFDRIEQAPMPMWSITLDGRGNGTLREMGAETPAEAPPHVLTYFAVDDMATAVTAAEAGGAIRLAGPQVVPAGTFAVLADAQGAPFALFEGELDD